MRSESYRKDMLYNFLLKGPLLLIFLLKTLSVCTLFLNSVFLAVTLSLEATPISCERCIDIEIKREREKERGEGELVSRKLKLS